MLEYQSMIKEVNVTELKAMQDAKEDFVLIDVRTPEEFAHCNLDGQLIPMQVIPERYSEIPKDKKVVIHCHHGGRSGKVAMWLEQNFGYDNLYNLAGGIHAWSLEVDDSIPTY